MLLRRYEYQWQNRLACVTPVKEVLGKGCDLTIRPFPGMPVIRDMVVDQSLFFEQYERTKPWLINREAAPDKDRLERLGELAKLDGHYECILWACCTSQCPFWWWNPVEHLGPTALLQVYRFTADSRDDGSPERLALLQDPFSLFRCRSIGNCTWVSPKGLDPSRPSARYVRKWLRSHFGRNRIRSKPDAVRLITMHSAWLIQPDAFPGALR